jgi:hypothetical protein
VVSRKNTGKAFISESISGGARDKRRAVDGRSASGGFYEARHVRKNHKASNDIMEVT